jgi:hypothetical protein
MGTVKPSGDRRGYTKTAATYLDLLLASNKRWTATVSRRMMVAVTTPFDDWLKRQQFSADE